MNIIINSILGFIVSHWKWFAGGVLLLCFLILFALAFRSCGKPKLDQKEIIEAQQAIEKQDRKVMVEILTNSDIREQGIDNSIKLAEEATEQSKKNYSGLSNEELAAELERRSKE